MRSRKAGFRFADVASARLRTTLAFACILAAAATAGDRQAHHMLVPVEEQIPAWEQVSFMYAGQWAYYFASQTENIRENGSFGNWRANLTAPHFDKDFYDYNLVFHTMAGSGYYGYYRAYGSSRARSFGLSVVSVLLFEFTVEATTERPSFQDIYQTPVLGSLIGMGMEDLSLRCLESDWTAVRGLGHVINPFTLVPGSAWQVVVDPRTRATGGRVAIPF